MEENKNLENQNLDNNNEGEEVEKTTYTLEEVQKLLQQEGDRRVSAALKKAEKKNAEKVKEAEKLAKMNADEKFQYELEQREKAIAEKERELAMAENKNEASKILAEKGISLDLVEFVVAEDADTMNANIQLLDKAFKASVKDEDEKRLKSSTPKKELPLDREITKEDFNKLSLVEQVRIYNENPTLYKELTK